MTQLLTPEQERQIARLRFPQPLESEFWIDWAEKIRKPVQIIAVIGFILCFLFIVATIALGASVGRETNFRSVSFVVVVLALTLVLVRSKIWIRVNPLPLWLVVAGMAFANGYGMLTMDSDAYERMIISNWMFFFVIVIGSGLALVRSATIAVAILLGSYLYLSFGLRTLDEPARTSNLMVIAQTVLFAMAASYVAERRARTEFLLGKLLDEERHKSEELLSNVLPREIAHRLKASPGILAQRHEDASVLFADIVGFTPYASSREPDEVVGFLDDLFSRFDHLVEEKGLEKIKTVGDAYMVAGGVLDRKEDHLKAMAQLAIELREVARECGVQIRLGIHSGPLVAGVIGKRKFLYDLWGETVNVASRMESHGLPDRVQVSSAVADRLKDHFELESRGNVEIKGMGVAETFFLDRKG